MISLSLLAAAFLFRLLYGLSKDFRTGVEDEKQIFLIGLKFYTTRQWKRPGARYQGPREAN